MEIQVAILAHGLPSGWPDDVSTAVSTIPQHVRPEDLINRTDLRDLPFVTIDGEDAKDFDDAVYCEQKRDGGFKLYVAIADVSHYVAPGSALDKEAARRGTSVYFPGQVVPMLPEALSNGICSLNPHVDRLCIVAEMEISPAGKISSTKFYRAVFHSHARLTYTGVHQWLSDPTPTQTEDALWPHLQALYALYKALYKTRQSRGAMDFNTTETRIEFDDQRKIKCIVPVVRNDAHRIIEECMLAANVASARWLENARIPALYRVHLAPEEEKVIALRAFLGEFGLSLAGGKKPTPQDFQETLQKIGADHLIFELFD